MTKKITVKIFIRALTAIGLLIWLAAYIYVMSSKSSPFVYDYAHELQEKEEKVNSQVTNLTRLNPHSRQLVDIQRSLCLIKICKKDSLPAVHYLTDLFNIASNVFSEWQQANLYLFGGNIYRDCGQFKQSQKCYQKSLSKLDELQITDKSNINRYEIQINKAINLNNMGIVYYLLGKAGLNKEECKENYSAAKNYFEQANCSISKDQNICLNRTIQNNMKECLIELKFLD